GPDHRWTRRCSLAQDRARQPPTSAFGRRALSRFFLRSGARVALLFPAVVPRCPAYSRPLIQCLTWLRLRFELFQQGIQLVELLLVQVRERARELKLRRQLTDEIASGLEIIGGPRFECHVHRRLDLGAIRARLLR